MSDAMFIAATGMQMQQKSVETIANNLANISTGGFKRSRVSFEDLVYRLTGAGNNTTAGAGDAPMWSGSGVGIASIAKLFSPGELKQTDHPMDLALEGDGFIELSAVDGGMEYSRGGTLSVDRDGFLSLGGMQLRPAIHVGMDMKSLTIKPDGTVQVQAGNDARAVEVGRIELAHFADVSGLVPVGANHYRTSDRSGEAIYARAGEGSAGTLAQGFVESSNVNVVQEVTDLMAAQRAYESSVKVIQAADEMLAMSNNLRK